MKKILRNLLIPTTAVLSIAPLSITSCSGSNTPAKPETFYITDGVKIDFEPLSTNELVTIWACKKYVKELSENFPNYFKQEFLNGLYETWKDTFSYSSGGRESSLDSMIVTINNLSIEQTNVKTIYDGPAHSEYAWTFDIDVHLETSLKWNESSTNYVNKYIVDANIKYDKIFFDFALYGDGIHYCLGSRYGTKYDEAPYSIDPQVVYSKAKVQKIKKVNDTKVLDKTDTFDFKFNNFTYCDLQYDVLLGCLNSGNFPGFDNNKEFSDTEFFVRYLSIYMPRSYLLSKSDFIDSFASSEAIWQGEHSEDWSTIHFSTGFANIPKKYERQDYYLPTKIRLDEENDLVFKEADPVDPENPRHFVIAKDAELEYDWSEYNWGDYDIYPVAKGELLDKDGNTSPYSQEELTEYWKDHYSINYLCNYASFKIAVEFTDINGHKIETPQIIYGATGQLIVPK